MRRIAAPAKAQRQAAHSYAFYYSGLKFIETVEAEERGMKQRSAMIAVWTTLLIVIGLVLAFAMTPGTSDEDFVLSPPPKPTPGSVPYAPWPEAAEVRLFVEDVPWSEQERTGKSTSRTDGIVLTAAQRAIVDQSVHLYRMTKREADRRAFLGSGPIDLRG